MSDIQLPKPARKGPWPGDPALYSEAQMRAMYQQGYAAALAQTAGVVDGFVAVPRDDLQTVVRIAMEGRAPFHSEARPALRRFAAMLAAAPAASGGEVWTREMIADVHKRGEELFQRINPPAAAPVSERARELLATEYDKIGLNGAATYIRSGQHGELDKAIIRAIEQALTQQRGEVAWKHDAESWGNALNEAAWIFVEQCPEKSALLFNNTKAPLRAAILKYAELVGAATTPQPSADAVRELAATWRKRAERKRFVGLKNEALLDEAHADELESLLSAASGEKGVG